MKNKYQFNKSNTQIVNIIIILILFIVFCILTKANALAIKYTSIIYLFLFFYALFNKYNRFLVIYNNRIIYKRLFGIIQKTVDFENIKNVVIYRRYNGDLFRFYYLEIEDTKNRFKIRLNDYFLFYKSNEYWNNQKQLIRILQQIFSDSSNVLDEKSLEYIHNKLS